MPRSGTGRIRAALFTGLAILLAGPAWLMWSALRSRDWDERTLKVHFESVRYEGAGFVFGYVIQNRTYRTARLRPEQTEIRALQSPDSPTVGYANLPQPLVIPARSQQLVHIRLELPSFPRDRWRGSSEEQTRRMLGSRSLVAPEVAADAAPGSDAAVSPLPMRTVPEPAAPADTGDAPPPQPWSPREWLAGLDGFEIVNQAQRAHIRFPRRW